MFNAKLKFALFLCKKKQTNIALSLALHAEAVYSVE